MLAACVDLGIALIAAAALLSLLPAYLLIDVHKPTIDAGLLILALPFALIGLSGLNEMRRAKVELYCYFKYFEFCAVCLLSIRAAMRLAEKWDHSWVAYTFYACRVLLDFYVLFIVWSCSTRMRLGEVSLVTRKAEESTPLKAEQFMP